MPLMLSWTDISGIHLLQKAMAEFEPHKVHRVAAQALNRAGSSARTKARSALIKQTGLSRKTLNKAMRPTRATTATLQYRIDARGGDVALRYFAAKEIRGGVTARPFGQSQQFAGAFIKGGRFPNRVPLKMGRQVLKRSGSGKFPVNKVKSGVIIPNEMVKGASAQAWQSTAARVLQVRIKHELSRLGGKALS